MAVLRALWFTALLLQDCGILLSAGSEAVSCPALAGVPGSPGHNGLPGRDGRDGHPGPKGDKGEQSVCVGPQGQTGGPDLLSTILQEEVNKIKQQLNVLLTDIKTKVAFSATLYTTGLPKNIGPNTKRVTLVYETAFTNIGNAYNTKTGIFTAPVKGVYYFIFVLFNPHNLSTAVALMKNGESIVLASDNEPGADTEDTATNSVSLLLEEGDRVYIELLENRKVYTDGNKRNTFSGHLLFTM
ncbi:adiponectin-like [Hemibagrus wyckioides]|nr:adiponectin-like [Hemibagrus wyckioides]